jgi:polysaccharide biosynthesis transport protein
MCASAGTVWIDAEAMAEEKASIDKRHVGAGLSNAWLAIVKRAKAVALLPIVAVLLASTVVSLAPDRYEASVVIQIDPREKLAPSSDLLPETAAPAAFEAERLTVDGQIATLKSAPVLGGVVEALGLAGDPEFQSRPFLLRITVPFAKADPTTIAREALADHLTIERVRNSSLIKVRATSRDAAKALAIANAIAARYIAQQRSSAWQGNGSSPVSPQPTASEKMFESLLTQYGFGRMLSGARIVEEAHLPWRPSGPKRVHIVAAVGASTLILMLALAVMLGRDAQLRTRNVEQTLACPHMTSLPSVATDDAAAMPARRARLIIAEPGCRYADAVRTACQELLDRSREQETRVILVVSAVANEGAEPFASNIAHHLAVAGQKSLLVDCDFQGKSLTRQLAPECTGGLLDQIAAHAPVENAILRDSLTGIHFLPASGPAPIPLSAKAALRSVGFAAAFQHLKTRFSTIVVSGPPLLETPDAQALTDLADQIVFLTAWHRTPRAIAKKAVSLLEANQGKVVGAVLADIPDDHDAGFMSFSAMFDEIRRAARLPLLERAA